MLREGRRGPAFWLLGGFFVLFVAVPLRAAVDHRHPVLPGAGRRPDLPDERRLAPLVRATCSRSRRSAISAAPSSRSLLLGLMVMVATVVVSLLAGLAFRRRFRGSTVLFYLAVASLIVPSILISLGIGLGFQIAGIRPAWYSSAFGAQLTWTLPFGLLIMFAVFNRFNRSYEEAARDLGATSWQTFRHVVLPLILPSLIGVGLFGFTLSYDEFARTLMTAGTYNTLPLEIYGMTTNVTTPVLYALGTLTTAFSFLIILTCLAVILILRARRARRLAA